MAQQRKSGSIADTKLAGENYQDLRRVASPGTGHHLAPWSIGSGLSWHCGQVGYLDGSPRQLQSVRTLWPKPRDPRGPLMKHW